MYYHVYELEQEKTFFLIKMNDETAIKIISNHPNIMKSKFPKTQVNQWYTMLIDDSYNSAQDVFDVISLVYLNTLSN